MATFFTSRKIGIFDLKKGEVFNIFPFPHFTWNKVWLLRIFGKCDYEVTFYKFKVDGWLNITHIFVYCLHLGLILELMASKLHQLQAKACQASKFVLKHGSAYHKQLLEQNKQYIQEPPTVEKCNELAKQLFYTRIARLYFYTFLSWHILLLCVVIFAGVLRI